jgi:hypothetical protein
MLQLYCESSGLPRSGDKRVNSNAHHWTAAAHEEKIYMEQEAGSPSPDLGVDRCTISRYLIDAL